MPDQPTPPEQEPGAMDALIREQYEKQKKAQERTAIVRAALRRWEGLQEAAEQAAVWEQENAEQIEQARYELNQAFIQAAISWLVEVWGHERPCPYCGHPHWSIGTPFEVALTDGGSLSPHFPVMCSTCGNTVFINAILAGLLP